MAWRIRALTARDADRAAALHAEGQPGTFLTRMGDPFLRALYRLLATAPTCYGSVAEENGRVVGLVVGTTDPKATFSQLLRRSGSRLLFPVALGLLRHPSLIGSAFQTLRYPDHAGALDGEAELFFIGVEAQSRGQGIGRALLSALIQASRARGLSSLGLTVDRANATAQRFYERNGMRPVSSFCLYGRPMAWYSLSLEDPGSAEARREC